MAAGAEGSRWFGRSALFVRTNQALLLSPAYLLLTEGQRLVVRDMIAAHDFATGFGEKVLGPEGFEYSFNSCRELLGRASFYRAVKRILEVGFFRVAVATTNGACNRYRPSNAWILFVPSAEEEKALVAHRARLLEAYDSRRLQGLFDFTFKSGQVVAWDAIHQHARGRSAEDAGEQMEIAS